MSGIQPRTYPVPGRLNYNLSGVRDTVYKCSFENVCVSLVPVIPSVDFT